jgi:hypothetical protein
LKTSPIWAALVAGAVLLQAVSPVYANNIERQFPTDQVAVEFSAATELWPTSFQTDQLPTSDEGGIQNVDFATFLEEITTGEADRITGLFVPGFGGFYVVQQSDGAYGSISPAEGVLTQFMRPASGRVIGLLAHNYAAGVWFNRFEKGDLLYVLFGDGRQEIYQLTSLEKYQALDGESSTSDFIDLKSGVTRSANQVYQMVYSGKPHLTLQTCIQKGDDLNWGRLFLVADLVE